MSLNSNHKIINHPWNKWYRGVLLRAITAGYQLPTIEAQIIKNQFMKELDDAGQLEKFELMYVLESLNAEDYSLINVVNPGVKDAGKHNTPIYTSKLGWKGAASSTLRTFWSCATANPSKYQQANASCGIYAQWTAGSQMGGRAASGGIVLREFNEPFASDLGGLNGPNSGLNTQRLYTNESHLTIMRRTSSADFQHSNDGGAEKTLVQTASTLAAMTAEVTINALNFGAINQQNVGFFFIGLGTIDYVVISQAWYNYHNALQLL